MSNKIIKVISTVILFAMITAILAGSVHAGPPSISANYTAGGQDKITNVGGIILGVATTVGMIVAVVMLVFLAIKYMSSSPNDKAEIKKHIVVWVVGAVLLFAASGVIALMQNLGQAVNTTLG